MEMVRRERVASTRVLMRAMGVGYTRAVGLLEELEKRGVIGPAKEKGTREVFGGKSAGDEYDSYRSDSDGGGADGPASPRLRRGDPDSESGSDGAGAAATTGDFSDLVGGGRENFPPAADSNPPEAGDGKPVLQPGAAAQRADSDRAPDGPQRGAPSDGTEGAPTSNLDAADAELRRKVERAIKGAMIKGGGVGTVDVRPADDGKNGNDGNDGGDGAEPPEEGKPDDEGPEESPSLRAFYDLLSLTPEHRAELKTKRGFTDAEIDGFGFRSSTKENRTLALGLLDRFPEDVLVGAGIFTRKGGPSSSDSDAAASPEAKPNAQFCGLGIKGKDAKGEVQWDWVNPILIPYWGPNGELLDLRAHKGSTASGRPRLYVARFGALAGNDHGSAESRPTPQCVVICEGEFKACAVAAALGGLVHAVALPGISMARDDSAGSYPLVQDLHAELKRVGVKRVAVVFDNEEKGDPKLASFKADDHKRYDTQIWSRYLAISLAAKNYDAKVGWLPDSWRDEKGKADWDGALARLRDGTYAKHGKDGSNEGGNPATAAEIRKLFLAVLKEARPGNEFAQLGLFDGKAEAIIRKGVAKKFLKPLLLSGSDRELSIAKKLDRFARESGPGRDGIALVRKVSEAYRNCIGCYYILKSVLKDRKDREWWQAKLESAQKLGRTDGEWDAAFAIERVLEGSPFPVSDFTLTPMYSVQRGPKINRRVLLRGRLGAERIAMLDAESLSQPTKFRVWLANQGGFSWSTGQQELDALMAQMNRELDGLQVYELSHFGWHADASAWAVSDCLITSPKSPDEPAIKVTPDEEGILWHQGIGYRIGETDWEGEAFRLGRPTLRPSVGLALGDVESEEGWKLVEGAEDDPVAVRSLFQQLAFYLRETLRGSEAYMALGAVLAFAAAPEFFEREGNFPGFWIAGERGGGKTTLAGWMMQMWGFRRSGGIKMGDSTRVGMQLAAQQYCNIPVWYEEYEQGLDRLKVEFLKSLMDRAPASKKEFGEQVRHIRTNAIVTGENTSGKSSIEQRFVHINVSEQRRKEGRSEEELRTFMRWFELNQKFFFTLGRFALLHRARFVAAFDRIWQEWCADPALKGTETRSRKVHGVSYAGFMAMVEILATEGKNGTAGNGGKDGILKTLVIEEAELQKFRIDMVVHTGIAVRDVRADVNVNQVWTHVVTAFKLGIFRDVMAHCFKAVQLPGPGYPPGAENQTGAALGLATGWASYVLYVDYAAVFEHLQAHLRKAGRELPLSTRDARDQMASQRYFLPGSHRQRFGKGASPSLCWAIAVDYHPAGYRPVSDEELFKSREGVASQRWADPRKGELFLVVEAAQGGGEATEANDSDAPRMAL